jgi:hypothetical protein
MPLTIAGFSVYAGITSRTFINYENKKEFFPITARIRDYIWQQKFSLAATEQLNPNIIARELGLIDKQDVTSGGEPIKSTTVNLSGLTNEQLQQLENIARTVRPDSDQ